MAAEKFLSPKMFIAGTPTGPDDTIHRMLVCIGPGLNRPFNANDKVAFDFPY
jgi:hypothetical protein